MPEHSRRSRQEEFVQKPENGKANIGSNFPRPRIITKQSAPSPIGHAGNTQGIPTGKDKIVVARGSNWLENGSIATWFDGLSVIQPPARDWIFQDVLSAGIVAIVAGAGGVGKGHLCLAMCVAGATGTQFGPFRSVRPGKWLYIGKEDDREEQQRRLFEIVKYWPGARLNDAKIKLLKQNLIIPPVPSGITFGPQLPEVLGEFCSDRRNKIDGIYIDPLTRFWDTESGLSMNSQEGAGLAHNCLGEIQKVTGATVLAVHHFNQAGRQAMNDGKPMDVTQISGSTQIVDLARFVIQLRSAKKKSPQESVTEEEIIQVQITKSNYSKLPNRPWDFERLDGGAIVPADPDRDSTGVKAVLEIVAAHQDCGIRRDDLIAKAKSQFEMGRKPTQDAITAAKEKGRIEYRGNRKISGDYRLFPVDSEPESAVGSDTDSRPGGNNSE